jgi:hypothetical protein
MQMRELAKQAQDASKAGHEDQGLFWKARAYRRAADVSEGRDVVDSAAP